MLTVDAHAPCEVTPSEKFFCFRSGEPYHFPSQAVARVKIEFGEELHVVKARFPRRHG